MWILQSVLMVNVVNWGNKIPSAWRLERVSWKLYGKWHFFSSLSLEEGLWLSSMQTRSELSFNTRVMHHPGCRQQHPTKTAHARIDCSRNNRFLLASKGQCEQTHHQSLSPVSSSRLSWHVNHVLSRYFGCDSVSFCWMSSAVYADLNKYPARVS